MWTDLTAQLSVEIREEEVIEEENLFISTDSLQCIKNKADQKNMQLQNTKKAKLPALLPSRMWLRHYLKSPQSI